MSANEEATEIKRLMQRFLKTKDKEEKIRIMDCAEKANSRILAEFSQLPNSRFYKQVIIDAPPIRKKSFKKSPIKQSSTQKPLKEISVKIPKPLKKSSKKPLPPFSKKSLQVPSNVTTVPDSQKLMPSPSIPNGYIISKIQKKQLMQELKIEEEIMKRIYKKKRKTPEGISPDFTIYVPSTFGALSNSMFKNTLENLEKKYPSFFSTLYHTVRTSGMGILSRTYASIMLFITLVSTIFSFFFLLLVLFATEVNIAITFISAVLGSVLGGIIGFILAYSYPSSQASTKSRDIEKDLPFAIIHMSAVAGSGAQPLSMFKLLLTSKEYPGLDSEIKKIVNYVNLFGYDLSTALKNVSITTPSKRFKELLNGIAATVESGGSLKSYLNSLAEDTMTTYKLERKKYVESLSTYSDIYTGILIAAPLLFIVTMAIINLLGGTISGVPLKTIALMGTFVVIPLMNIVFYLFLNMTQPGT